MTRAPTFDDIFAVMSAASVGDTAARVPVPEAPRPNDVPTRFALALNLLLDDLALRAVELRISENHYRQLFEFSPLPMWVYDSETLAFLAVNDAAVLHYGYTREEFLGMTIREIRPEEDVPRLMADIRSREPVQGPHVWKHRKKDGTIISVEVSSRDFSRNGRRARLVLANDITARERAEEALRQSEARFSCLHESGLIGISVADLSGKILEANDSFLAMVQASRDELQRGLHVSDLTAPEFRGLGDTILEQLRKHGTARTFEKEFLRKDGRCVRALVGPALLDSERIISFILDISERQRLEQLSRQAFELETENRRILEASRMKSVFLGNMSHELRTPLNAIIGFTGVLLMRLPGPLTGEQERQLAIVKSSADHLLLLINDLLDLSKIESGKVTIVREQVHVQALLEDVRASLQPLAAAKPLEFVVTGPRDPVYVMTDVRAAKQIVINLVGNAIKFTASGSVTVTLEQRHERGGAIVIAVTDTGVGIKTQDHERMFHAFAQMDSTARDGSGLGLHLSRNLAELIGGTIDFESEYGKGSRFWLTLPRNP